MGKIVINASPLILLSKIGCLHLLNALFASVYIPEAVINEVTYFYDRDNSVDLSRLVFNRLQVSNRLAVAGLLGRLHLGEVEVIVGAVEQVIPQVIIDDNLARTKAKQLGLSVTGTIGVLLRGSKCGLIGDMQYEIEKLRFFGMYISDSLLEKILKG